METGTSSEVHTFSLVQGGPLYRLMLGLRLIANESYVRMAASFALLTWAPLFLISSWQGMAGGDAVPIPFLRDFAIHPRFLVAIPLLILAEPLIDRKLRTVVQHFVRSNLIAKDDLLRYASVLRGVLKWRDSVLAESFILLVVAAHGFFSVSTHGWIARDVSSWYGVVTPQGWRLTFAGWWAVASSCVFVFLLYRWLWRLIIWSRFLWQVARLDLQLVPTHPDQAGGLAFVGRGLSLFGLVLFAASSVAAGVAANLILYQGETLNSLRAQIAVFSIVLTIPIMSPLLPLTFKLHRLKKKGLLDYGALATGYVQSFDDKWLRKHAAPQEALLGSADIQSLADLSNSYQIVQKMTIVPLGRKTALILLASAAAPFLPLLLTVFPLEELLKHALKLLF